MIRHRTYSGLFTIVIFLLSASLKAQDDEPAPVTLKLPKVSFRTNVGVPTFLSNEVLRKKFVGIYEASGCLTLKLSSSFFAGTGYRNGLYSASNRTKYSVKTKFQTNSGFIRLGYTKIHSNTFFSHFSINTGYGRGLFTNVSCDDKEPERNFSFVYFEPMYSMNLYADDEQHLALGFYAAINYMTYSFNPKSICFDQETSVNDLKTDANTVYFVLGIDLYWGIKKRPAQ